MSVRRWLVLLGAVLVCLLGAEAWGFGRGNLLAQPIWEPAGLHRLIRLVGIFLSLAAAILTLVPWAFTGLLCTLVLVLTATAVGPAAPAAVVFFLVSACALGHLLVRRPLGDLPAMLVGAAAYLFLMYATARLPVQYGAVWAVVLTIPVALDARGVARRAAAWLRLAAGAELRTWGERAAFALLAFALLMQWLVVLKPEQSADGLAMHLAIPANLAVHHAFTLRPADVVWSVMPMGADFLYSVAYLLGGEFAARLLNFAMLLVVVGLLYQAVRRWVGPGTGWLLAALFASTPLIQLVTGSLFVENVLAAFLVGSLMALWDSDLVVACALAGAAVATKLGAAAYVAAALPFFVWEARRGGRAVWGVAVFLALAVPPYLIAWRSTSNPIFPFRNERIHSPLIDRAVQFQDNGFRQPLAARTPWDLTFRTHLYYEAQDGAFGFQYLLLGALGLLALPLSQGRMAWSAGVAGTLAAILVLRSEPNARYLYPALVLLTIPLAPLLAWLNRHGRVLGRVLLALGVACILVNLYFMAASGWYHKSFYLQQPFSEAARQLYLRESVPIRPLMEWFERAHPGEAILEVGDNDLADTTGTVYANHWHHYLFLMQLRGADGLPGLVRLMEQRGIRYFAGARPGTREPPDPPILSRFLEACTIPEYQLHGLRVSRLDPACDGWR